MTPTQQNGGNNLFIKFVSPLANEETVKDFFRQAKLPHEDLTAADDVLEVKFIEYPNSIQKFCRVTFGTSSGVTSGMSLHGNLLHGVPTSFTVIDPSKISPVENQTTSSANTACATSILQDILTPPCLSILASLPTIPMQQVPSTDLPPPARNLRNLIIRSEALSSDGVNAIMAAASAAARTARQAEMSHATAQASVLQAMFRIADTQPGGSPYLLESIARTAQPRESEAEQIARTLFVTNFPDEWGEDQVLMVLRDYMSLGHVIDRRIDRIGSASGGSKRFILAELPSAQAVDYAVQLPECERSFRKSTLDPAKPEDPKDDIAVLQIERARTTVRPREPEGVSFTIDLAKLAPVPIAYQSLNKLHIEDKLHHVRRIAAKLMQQRASQKSEVREESEPPRHEDDCYRSSRHGYQYDNRSHPYRSNEPDYRYSKTERRRRYDDERWRDRYEGRRS